MSENKKESEGVRMHGYTVTAEANIFPENRGPNQVIVTFKHAPNDPMEDREAFAVQAAAMQALKSDGLVVNSNHMPHLGRSHNGRGEPQDFTLNVNIAHDVPLSLVVPSIIKRLRHMDKEQNNGASYTLAV